MSGRGIYWLIVQLAAIAAGIYVGISLYNSVAT